MKKNVWIVSEGSPGHISQSVGLANMLGQSIPLEITRIETRHQFGGVIRTLVRLWMGASGRPLSDSFIRRQLACEWPDSPPPDFIIVSGGKAVFAAKSLATKHGAPLVFIGERKPYPSSWFHTVLTPSEYERDENDIPLRKIPVSITFEKLEQAANAWTDKPEGRLWAMVLGGQSLSHRYSESDWQSLGQAMNQLAQRHGIRWLIASSRRTGADAETWLKKTLHPEHLAEAAWWAQASSQQLHAYLGAAERTFVTQDSVTMVTETTVCKLTPVVLAPQDVKFPERSFLPDYFKALEEDGQIVRKKISELADLDLKSIESADLRKNTHASIVETLIDRLGLCGSK